jgi:hypothetical protein
MTSIPRDQYLHSIDTTCSENDWFTGTKTRNGNGQSTRSIDRLRKTTNQTPNEVHSSLVNCRFDGDMGKITANQVMNKNLAGEIVYNMDPQDDSPGVARARRLLSTMKEQRENASLQLQKSGSINTVGNYTQRVQSGGAIKDRTIKHQKKDTSYYDTINQELRSRIQQKIDSQQQQTSNHSSKSLSSYISSSKISDDNQTVSTAQSTFCKTTAASSVSSLMGSSSISTASVGLSRPLCYPLKDSPNTSSTSKIPVPAGSILATTTALKPTTPTLEPADEIQKPATNAMIAELTALLAQCNESVSSSSLQTTKKVTADDKQSQGKNRIKSRPKHIIISTSLSSPALSPRRNRRKSSSPCKRTQQRSSSQKKIHVREISFVKQVEESTPPPPAPRSRSEHSRSISFRKVQSFDSSRVGDSHDPVFRRSDNNKRITRRTQVSKSRSMLFPSASADDANSNDDYERRTRKSSPQKYNSTTTKLVTASRQRDRSDRKVSSKSKESPVSITVGTIQSGASTASVTTSVSSDNSKTHNNKVFGIQSRPQHLSMQTMSPSSASIPRLVHSYHDRTSVRDDISAISPVSTYRSNSLSPKARRRPIVRPNTINSSTTHRLNRLSRGLSLNDIDAPFLGYGTNTSRSTDTTAGTFTPSTSNRTSKTNSVYSTDLLLKQVRHDDKLNEDTLDTPEGRKLFIRNLYRSDGAKTKGNNAFDLTSNTASNVLQRDDKVSTLIKPPPHIVDINKETNVVNQTTTYPKPNNDTNGVRSIINAFQAINTAIKQDIDVSTRIKAEYPIPRKFQNQQKQSNDKLDSFKTPTGIHTSTIIDTNDTNEKPDECIKHDETIAVFSQPKGILVNRNESVVFDGDGNETATFDATLDVTYNDDDEKSVYSSGSDTSGWISNSSNTYTLEYDSDIAARSNKVSPILSINSKMETKKKKKRKDTKEITNGSNHDIIMTSTQNSYLNNDNNCADTVSLLSADWIEEEEGIGPVAAITVDNEKTITPPLQKKNTQTNESIDFSPFEELQWNEHSPSRRKRVCFAPSTDVEHLEIYYYPPEDVTVTEENDDIVNVITKPQSSTIFESDQVLKEKRCTCGGLFDQPLSNGISDVNVLQKCHVETALSAAKVPAGCENHENLSNVGHRFGVVTKGTRSSSSSNKKHVQKGKKRTGNKDTSDNNSNRSSLLPARGGMYDLAIQSGLTKNQLRSREPYKVSVNLQRTNVYDIYNDKECESNGIIKECMSDQRCGARGGMMYLASSITHIPKRKPLEPDIYWVD